MKRWFFLQFNYLGLKKSYKLLVYLPSEHSSYVLTQIKFWETERTVPVLTYFQRSLRTSSVTTTMHFENILFKFSQNICSIRVLFLSSALTPVPSSALKNRLFYGLLNSWLVTVASFYSGAPLAIITAAIVTF